MSVATLPTLTPETDRDEWATPPDVFAEYDREFRFTIDACASDLNHKTSIYYTKADNGLEYAWAPWTVWVNPPYSDIAPWVRKAALEAESGATVVCLLPPAIDTAWFHDWVYGRAELRFRRGRVKFLRPDGRVGAQPAGGNMIAIYRPKK